MTQSPRSADEANASKDALVEAPRKPAERFFLTLRIILLLVFGEGAGTTLAVLLGTICEVLLQVGLFPRMSAPSAALIFIPAGVFLGYLIIGLLLFPRGFKRFELFKRIALFALTVAIAHFLGMAATMSI